MYRKITFQNLQFHIKPSFFSTIRLNFQVQKIKPIESAVDTANSNTPKRIKMVNDDVNENNENVEPEKPVNFFQIPFFYFSIFLYFQPQTIF